MDVLTAAYAAAGPGQPTVGGVQGSCARCGVTAGLRPVRTVVSKQFTAFDEWRDPGGVGLCPACSWAYTTAELRRGAYLVNAPRGEQAAQQVELSRAQLREVLRRPLDRGQALIVALRAGRKHLLTRAQWGQITLEDAGVAWTVRDVGLLALVEALRGAGFTGPMLGRATPEWAVLRRLNPERRSQVQRDWALLAGWRASRLWLDVAITACGPSAAAA